MDARVQRQLDLSDRLFEFFQGSGIDTRSLERSFNTLLDDDLDKGELVLEFLDELKAAGQYPIEDIAHYATGGIALMRIAKSNEARLAADFLRELLPHAPSAER